MIRREFRKLSKSGSVGARVWQDNIGSYYEDLFRDFLLLLELILHSLISIQNDFPLSSCCKKRLLMWTWWPKLSCSLFCSSSSCCVISVQQRLSLSLRLWRTAQRRGWTLYAILHGCYAHWLLCYLEWFIANIILMYFNNRHT